MKKILLNLEKKLTKNQYNFNTSSRTLFWSFKYEKLNCFKSLKSENFNIINLNDYLIKMPAHKLNKLPINKFDYHFSKYGHQIIYKILRNIL